MNIMFKVNNRKGDYSNVTCSSVCVLMLMYVCPYREDDLYDETLNPFADDEEESDAFDSAHSGGSM